MRPSSNTQSYGRGIPESLHNPRLNGLYQRALTTFPNSGSRDPLRRPRDAKPYTNPYMPRTVAHDPLARVPTTVTARSVASKSREQSIFEEEIDGMRPASNTQSHGGSIPDSLHNPRLDGLYQRALTNLPNSRSVDPLRRPTDAKPYTNPYMPRTVAYDPQARVPPTVTARSVASKSTLKPEVPVYLTWTFSCCSDGYRKANQPRSAGDKGPGSTRPTGFSL